MIKHYFDHGIFTSYLSHDDGGERLEFEHNQDNKLQKVKDVVMRDFVHGLSMYFSDQSDEHVAATRSDTVLDSFGQLYQVLAHIHDLRIKLDSIGHPEFVNKKDGYQVILKNEPQIIIDLQKKYEEELMKKESQWSESVKIVQESHPRMLFLSPKLLSTFLFVTDDAELILPYAQECFPDYAFSIPANDNQANRLPPSNAITVKLIRDVLKELKAQPVQKIHQANETTRLKRVGELLKLLADSLEKNEIDQTITVEPGTPKVIIFTDSPSNSDLFYLAKDLCETDYAPPTVLVTDFALLAPQFASTNGTNENNLAHYDNASYLQIVLQRAVKFPNLPCVIMHAERMSFGLRSILLQWLKNVEDNKVKVAPVTLVFTDKSGADVFVAFRTEGRQRYANTREHQDDVKKHLIRLSMYSKQSSTHRFEYLCSKTGAGKTFYISGKLRAAEKDKKTLALRIAVNEDFSPSKVARDLQAAFAACVDGVNQLCLHINTSAYANYDLLHSFL